MPSLPVDIDLIRRYDAPGPRYTSYPTAVQFRPDFPEADYRREASALSERSARDPLSLYVHIPFCASPCFYCGCNRVITRSYDRAEAYLHRLDREIELQSGLFERTRTVEQMHFGGGTPTFLRPADLESLIEKIGRRFTLTDSGRREYSIEIDPRTVSRDYVRELVALGFNRMSLGVQDFDLDVQKTINRVQTIGETLRTVDAARRAGVCSLSFDLIYGLPRQTLEGFSRTLDTVIDVRPDRLAVYGYAHLPEIFTAQRRLERSDLPTPQVRLALLTTTIERLTAAGYEYIGMDHFALPGDELVEARRTGRLQRNFQGYSTRARLDLVALGASAIGRVGDVFAQNAKLLPDYYAALDAGHLPIRRGLKLGRDDRIRAAVIQSLMCQDGVDFDAIEAEFDIEFTDYFDAELARLAPLERDGLVERRAHAIGVTEPGRWLVRHVAMIFDAYLAQANAGARYSKVI